MGINFQNVTFKYSKKSQANQINNVTLNIKPKNEFITILGQTGSGKSTLVQHMNALLFATSGSIQVFDINVVRSKRIKLKPIRNHVGLVFQFPEYQIFEATVLDDIMFGPMNFGKTKEEAKALALHAAQLVGLSLELLERSPFSLSGGQLRRVAIAGILAVDPDILILDEPTVGLDPKGKEELMNLLVNLQKETEKTIIMISHDMNIVAKFAKRILVMNHGNLVYDGFPQELFDNEEMLNEYNLDLPSAGIIAKTLKEKHLIEYTHIPLTIEALYELIKKGGINNER